MAASRRRHTHNFRKCSHASVRLAQARPNYSCTLLLQTKTVSTLQQAKELSQQLRVSKYIYTLLSHAMVYDLSH